MRGFVVVGLSVVVVLGCSAPAAEEPSADAPTETEASEPSAPVEAAEPEPVAIEDLLLADNALGSGWERANVDPSLALFTGRCDVADLVLSEADSVEAVRYESGGAVVVHAVLEVPDAAATAEEVAAAADGCPAGDEALRVVAVSFAGAAPPTDVYRLTHSSTTLGIDYASAWAVTQVDAETLSMLGVNTNDNTRDEVPDPIPVLDEAMAAVFGQG